MWGALAQLGRVFRRFPVAATVGCLILVGVFAVLLVVGLVLQAVE